MNFKSIKKTVYIVFFSTILLSCKQSSKVETSKISEPSENIKKKEKTPVISKNKLSLKKWIIADNFNGLKINKLPFFFDVYFKNNIPETTYPYYLISEKLERFLKNHDYEGEKYECFLLPNTDNLNVLLVNVLRGDSNYYLVITTDSDEIKSMEEVGHIGDENDIKTFDISEEYIITKYKGFRNNKVILKKTEILKGGKSLKKNSTFTTNTIVHAQVETYLNIRSAPNSSGNIVGKAYPKDGLKIIEVLDGWLKVKLDNTEGYVSSDFVK